MGERRNVAEGEVPRSVSSDVDARVHGRHVTASVAINKSKVLVLFLGLLLFIVPRVVWATLHTIWLRDALHPVDMSLLGAATRPYVS